MDLKGAFCVELQSVNDIKHKAYYGKADYNNAKNFVLKVNWTKLQMQRNEV